MNAQPGPSTGTPTSEERNWAMAAHFSSLSGLIIPFGNALGPLVVWLVKREQSAFVADQAKEALNFNITVLLAALVAIVLAFVIIGIPLLIVIGLGWLVLTIVAGIKANEGATYRYPLTVRFVK
jgi:hypothetical protein